MNERMKEVWLEISRMLGEPTREELDVFLRTWQRAMQAEREECIKVCEDEIKRVKPVYSPTADIILRRIRERAQPGHDVIELPWVGLTDEELREFDVDPIEAKLMIAKLRSKNEDRN